MAKAPELPLGADQPAVLTFGETRETAEHQVLEEVRQAGLAGDRTAAVSYQTGTSIAVA